MSTATEQRSRRERPRTLYIETSNYRRLQPIKYPGKQARFIEAAHRNGMKVVAWYLPGFHLWWSDDRTLLNHAELLIVGQA